MLAREAESSATRLTQELRRSPTEAQIAGEMGVEVAKYRGFLDQYSRAQGCLLEARSEVDDRPAVEDSSAVGPQSQATLEELRARLVGA